MGRWRKGALFDRLSVNALSTQYLMPTLIQFFIGKPTASPDADKQMSKQLAVTRSSGVSNPFKLVTQTENRQIQLPA